MEGIADHVWSLEEVVALNGVKIRRFWDVYCDEARVSFRSVVY